MSMLGTKQPKYKDGRTKQSFKDETDINKIMQRAQRTGTISHLAKYEAVYGDFADLDLLQAQLQVQRGEQIFSELPSEIRKEFHNQPHEFFKFVNDPANAENLHQVLPALAAPGRQNISLNPRIQAAQASSDAASEPQANDNQPTQGETHPLTATPPKEA